MKITPITTLAIGQLIVISQLDPSLVSKIQQGETCIIPTCVVACVGPNNKLFSPSLDDIPLETLNFMGRTIYMANLIGSGMVAVWPQLGDKIKDLADFYGSWGYIDGDIGNLYERVDLQST